MAETIISNVLVFNGEIITGPKTVFIKDGLIQFEGQGGNVIDGTGCTLLPGFIDGHVHISNEEDLHSAAKHGVTTVCDLGAYPKQLFKKLKAVRGTTEYLSSGLAAFPPGSTHSKTHAMTDTEAHDDGALHNGIEGVEEWMNARVIDDKVDFIKVIGEDDPGFDKETLCKLASAAKAHGKLSIMHANGVSGYKRGLEAGFDMLTHVPADKLLDADTVRDTVNKGVPVCPTILIFTKALANPQYAGMLPPNSTVEIYMKNVSSLHEAGVTIVTGTDSNSFGMGVDHGAALHEEMALLVKAGMTPIQVLKASTMNVANLYRFGDRGKIQVGLKADLVLVEGDPTESISNSKNIKMVWKDGVPIV